MTHVRPRTTNDSAWEQLYTGRAYTADRLTRCHGCGSGGDDGGGGRGGGGDDGVGLIEDASRREEEQRAEEDDQQQQHDKGDVR